MNPLSNAHIALADPDLKRTYNRTLFKEVAPRYDLITRILSLGRDRSWKKWMLNQLPHEHETNVLDIACGTGDITRALQSRFPRASVKGLDLTLEMLEIARTKSNTDLEFIEGDMMQTNLDSGSFDIITGGYALRNAPDLNQALREVYRLLRPGGYAAFLDFSAPVNPYVRKLHYGLLWFWGALWGWLLHGNPRVYAYIARSLSHYPDHQHLHQQFSDHHMKEVTHRKFMLGMIEVIILRK